MIADLFLGGAVSAATSLLVCRLMISAGLWDAPHLARHQHKQPTPTSGGVGIATGYALGVCSIVALAMLAARDWLPAGDASRLAIATAFALVFLAIGFLDDTFALGPRGKFGVFGVAAVAAAWAVGIAHVFAFGDGVVVDVGLIAGLIGSALWIFTLINSVNFMDGANGLAMGSCAVGLGGLAVISVRAGAADAAMMAACGAGALLGFLRWNYPKGRLFAGDSGALFAGALAALASLMAITQGRISPLAPPMLFFPMLADALLTLAWRAGRGRNLLNGHAEHLYQVAIRAGLSHGQISAWYWLAALVCACVAAFSASAGGWTPLIAFASLAVAALLISAIARAWAVKRQIAEVP